MLSSPLSRLRKALGPGRLAGRGELSLTLPPTAWIDWEAAFGGLREAHAAVEQERWREGIDAARAALEIADGGLLPGLEADWIDAKRAELADLRLELLELIAACGIRLGGVELPRAEQAARAAVEAAPFRESARAALIEVLRARGNVADALRAFEDARTLLRDELGAAPGPLLLRLHESCCGPNPRRRRPPLPGPAGGGALGPVVGGADARARPQAELRPAPRGEASVVLVATVQCRASAMPATPPTAIR